MVVLADFWDSGYHYQFQADDMPLVDQNAKYADYNGHRFYNSAILIENNAIMIFAVAGVSTKVYRKNLTNGSTTHTWTLNVKDANGNAYRPSSYQVFNDIYRLQSFTFYDSAGSVTSYIPKFTSSSAYMAYIQEPIVNYIWSSVPSISGKNGILPFTCLKNDLITGEETHNLTSDDFTQFSSATKYSNLVANVPAAPALTPPGSVSEVPVIYAGSVDYLGVKRIAASPLLFYIHVGINTVSYSVQSVKQNGWQGFIIDEENEVAKPVIIYTETVDDTTRYVFEPVSLSDAEMHTVWLFIHGHTSGDDSEDDTINKEIPDSTGITPYHDTKIDGLTLMTKSAIDTGFTTMYKVTKEELKGLSNFLWSDSFLDTVKKFFNDPREIVVGISIMPIAPDVEENSEYITAGRIQTNVLGYKLTNQSKIDTYGEINISENEFTRKFLHYPPYTRITAHLPFVGEHSLDVNDITGHKLTLKYCFDFLTGSCVAEIDKDDNPRYFFGGSCGMQIPTSSEDFSRVYSGILSAGATLGGTLATIAAGGLSAPLIASTGANMIANGVNMTPAVQYSSGSGSINGMLGNQTAFLVIEKPIDRIAENQKNFIGKPSLIKATLGDCNGFVKCLSVHLDNVSCMAQERSEIERQLLAGVRIEPGNETPSYTPTTPTDHGLIFLKCISDMDVIGKSWTDPLTVEGKLLFDQSLYNPVFLMQGNFSAYNYVYVPEFDRFYYITEQQIKTGNLTQINLQEDVLQSWKTQILQNEAILERSENEYNTYLADTYVWAQQNKEVVVVPFLDTRPGKEGEQLKFDRPSNTYILTIAGGG